MTDAALSVYVQLPFCARKCHYCDFNSRPGSERERRDYLEALLTEIDLRAETLGDSHVHTIFFGGGTPTVYEAAELAGVLQRVCRAVISLAAPPLCAPSARGQERGDGSNDNSAPRPPVEITCEANPETVDLPKLRALREAGFNRLSIGAQSFDDEELQMLGRGHSAGQIVQAVTAAREAGFDNLSLDLIYALPGQTVKGWRHTLERALALEPEHLSAYGLDIAEGTPLFERHRRGEIEAIGESAHLAMRELTRELCSEAGLQRYEISNYALPGRECGHNITYWRNEQYLGLGAGAWSYLDGVRSANLRDPERYIAAIRAGGDARDYEERLGPDDALAEAVMMGLRLTEGLSLTALSECHGEDRVCALVERAEGLAGIGLVEMAGGYLRLTDRGEALHEEVCVRLT